MGTASSVRSQCYMLRFIKVHNTNSEVGFLLPLFVPDPLNDFLSTVSANLFHSYSRSKFLFSVIAFYYLTLRFKSLIQGVFFLATLARKGWWHHLSSFSIVCRGFHNSIGLYIRRSADWSARRTLGVFPAHHQCFSWLKMSSSSVTVVSN